ncbi:hypothetical protein GCM10022286_10190 [Gryllotalpicola daejeonensis]|uniref:Pentapeptide repeat-containing protein n=1 Tax=Gryllotalpicola daejeonensis TaxID=993087 RepID=A0ABP7ZHC8_9MICO
MQAGSSSSPIVVAATLIAGGLTAAYAVLRLRAHLVSEERGRLDRNEDRRAIEKHRSDQEIAFVERFSKAVALLSADQSISRIAGAHLILALGDEWPNGAQRCLDVLLSHLRGIHETHALEAESSSSRGVVDEIRLITDEVFRRLRANGPAWDVVAGDFSETALASVDLEGIKPLHLLDLRRAHVLGNVAIPEGSTLTVPSMEGLVCDGQLDLVWSAGWTGLNIAKAEIAGSVSVTGRLLGDPIDATGLRAESLLLAFESIQADVLMETAKIERDLVIGNPGLGCEFGTERAPVSVLLSNSSFETLVMQRAARGPRLDLRDAVGAVDLSYSSFEFEVDASHLDAGSGLSLHGARFDGPLVLDGAVVPATVDLEGVILSAAARNALQSSEFPFRDLVLGIGKSSASPRSLADDRPFDWKDALNPLRQELGVAFLQELEARMSLIEANLPVDWPAKPSFTAHVMSEVARAAARADAPAASKYAVESALRALIEEPQTAWSGR